MTRYTNEFFGVSNGDRSFDLPKAVEAYEWVIANPDEAPFVVSKMLFDNTAFYMEANRDQIEPVVKSYIAKRLTEVQRGLSRRVSKSSTAAQALEVVDSISKAAGDPPDPDIAQRVKRQWRDPRGRFRVMNRKIVHSESGKPMADNQFRRVTGLKSEKIPQLKGERKAAYQNDYLQVLESLRQVDAETGLEGTSVFARYNDGSISPAYDGSAAIASVANGHNNDGLVRIDDYQDGKRVDRIEVVADDGGTDRSGRIMGVDALTALTNSPGFATSVMGAGSAAADGLDGFTNSTGFQTGDIGTNEGMWRRLEASSKLANDIGGKYLPENAQLALKVGEWAGKYAPQAEKVIGPTARRSSYRYRGVEKQPNRVYQSEIDALRHDAGSGRQAHEWLIKGKPLDRSFVAADGSRIDRQQSKTIQTMQSLLPDPGLYELNRQSGTIPPSQGIIIDRSGKVVTEAVGYGEDWYLPFNLRNLSKLKGGEYIRTRAYGGLTTEDIYVGLVSGARSVTVVSHSGVYSMEFDDDYRGARRYNDKSGRMHARYAQLLDAVKSGDVQLGQPSPARMQEIYEKAGQDTGLDPNTDYENKEFQDQVKRLKLSERRNPSLAKADRDAAMMRAINEHLINNNVADGVPVYLQTQIARGAMTEDQAQEYMGNPVELAKVTGATRSAMRAVEMAEKINRQNLNPLALNARGYDRALSALKEQFPYYIKDVSYTPGSAMGSSDSGYIKPRFNRPEAALEGFYDPTITGTGKIKGDRTKYQNLSVVGTPGRPKRFGTGLIDERDTNYLKRGEKEDPDAPDVPDAPDGPKGAGPKASKELDFAENMMVRNDLLAVAQWIQKQTHLGPNARDIDPSKQMAGLEVGPDAQSYIAGPGNVDKVYGDANAIKSALEAEGRNGPTANAIRGAMKRIQDQTLFDVPADIARAAQGRPSSAPVPLPDTTLKILDGLGNTDYVFSDLKGKHPKAHYDAIITDILASDPELRSIVKSPGSDEYVLTPDATYASVTPAIIQKAGELTNDAVAWERHKVDPGNYPAPPLAELALKRKATALAKLLQAYKDREIVAPPAPQAAAPKADAPVAGGDVAEFAANLVDKARPYQEKIRSFTGMEKVASELDSLIAQAVASRRREAANLPVGERPMHMVFTGNPGVGKTMIAREVAPLYYELGLTTKNTFVDADPSQIKGEYVNQIREHTKKWLDDHKGGVIFVDEAHQLAHDKYGRQVLETMVPWSTNNRDTVIILAGYPEGMKYLFQTDPGLTSRFPKKINFEDYDSRSLVKIGNQMMANQSYTASAPVKRAIDKAVASLPEKLPRDEFANGRSVETFIARMADAQEMRLLHVKNPSDKELSTFSMTDVANARKAMGIG